MTQANFFSENANSVLEEYIVEKKIFPMDINDSLRKKGVSLLVNFFSHCSDIQVGKPVDEVRRDEIQNDSRGFFSLMMLDIMQQLWPVVPDAENVPETQKKIAFEFHAEFERLYKFTYIMHRMDSRKSEVSSRQKSFNF